MDIPEIVLYFDNSIEILCASYILWKYSNENNKEPQFILCNSGNKKEIADVIKEKHILVIDTPIFTKLNKIIDLCASATIVSRRSMQICDGRVKVHKAPISIIEYMWKMYYNDTVMTFFINSLYEYEMDSISNHYMNFLVKDNLFSFNKWHEYDINNDMFLQDLKLYYDMPKTGQTMIYMIKINNVVYSFGKVECLFLNKYDMLVDYIYCESDNKITIRKSNSQVIDKPIVEHIKKKVTLSNSWIFCDSKLSDIFVIELGEEIIKFIKCRVQGCLLLNAKVSNYYLIKLVSPKQIWLTPPYIDFIKKKYLDIEFIVLDMISEGINRTMHKYMMIYNEYSIKDKGKKMMNMVSDSKHMLVFESDKEFADIFRLKN